MNINVVYVTFLCLVKVNSNDLILGTISPKSRLLLSDVRQAMMAPWVRTRQLTFQGHADEVICALRIYDLKAKKDGVVRLDVGDIGEPKIVISLRSGGPFKGYAFKIEVYVERTPTTSELDNNTALKDFVKNITKSTLLEALEEIIHKDDDEEKEVEEQAEPVTTKKPKVIKKKRKRKKSKKVNDKRTTIESTENPHEIIAPVLQVEPFDIGKVLNSARNSMVKTESKVLRGSKTPKLSRVYQKFTRKLSLPTVRISNDLLIKNAPTNPAMDSTVNNLEPVIQ